MKDFFPAAALSIGMFSLILVLVLQPRAGKPITVIYPVSWTANQVMAHAIGVGDAARILRTGPLENIITLDRNQRGFAERLRSNGAILVLNGRFHSGCGTDKLSRLSSYE